MYMIDVQIVGYVDSSFPGWIEYILRDASNREWLFIDKIAIFSDQDLHEISRYPQQGMIACEIIR